MRKILQDHMVAVRGITLLRVGLSFEVRVTDLNVLYIPDSQTVLQKLR